MLLRQFLSASIALMTLLVAAVPVAGALPNECRLEADPDPENGRLGRPCVTLTLTLTSQTGEATCASFEHTHLEYDRDPICTFYVFLVPFHNGGTVGTEIDLTFVYVETNGVQGLQSTSHGPIPEDDNFLL